MPALKTFLQSREGETLLAAWSAIAVRAVVPGFPGKLTATLVTVVTKAVRRLLVFSKVRKRLRFITSSADFYFGLSFYF